MTKKALDVLQALVQLQKDVLSSSTASLTEKYGIPFLKSESSSLFSVITSGDLSLVLKEKFKIDITLKELNMLLPTICPSLKISLEPMASFEEMPNPVPVQYILVLADKV